MDIAELKPAHMWDCPVCGRENFCRVVVPELSESEAKEMKDEHGIEEYDQGYWVSAPTHVTCAHCGKEFATNCFNPEDYEPYED